MLDFSDNFNRPDFSDVCIRLVSTLETSHAGGKRKRGGGGEAKARKRTHGENQRARPADSDEEAPPGSSRVLYVHRMVLSKSEYFQGRLQRWKQPFFPGTAPPAGGGHGSTHTQPPPGAAAPGSQLARLCGRVRRTGFTSQPQQQGQQHGAGHHALRPLRPHNGPAASTSDAVTTQRIELVERMEPCDMDAAELVLKCMYKGAVPSEVAGDVVLLLRGSRMAARFQVPACERLLLAAASPLPLPPGTPLEDAMLTLACARGGGGGEGARAPAWLAGARRALLQEFGDVPALVTDAGLRARFAATPHGTLIEWLACDKLGVQSENDVVYAVSGWVAAQEAAGRQPSAAELAELAACVRVGQCTPSYLLSVLPGLPWLCATPHARYLPWAALQRTAKLREEQVAWPGPPDWQRAARTGTTTYGKHESRAQPLDAGELSWVLSPADVERLCSASTDGATPMVLHAPHQLYANGYVFGLDASCIRRPTQQPQQQQPSTTQPAARQRGGGCDGDGSEGDRGGEGGWVLSCYVYLADGEMEAAGGVSGSGHAVHAECTLTVAAGGARARAAGPRATHAARHTLSRLFTAAQADVAAGGNAWGVDDVLCRSATSPRELLSPLLLADGCMRLGVEMHRVN
ncbi:hypothetical protein FOA52_009781 [Chlamydomonas sp. UWO 241]|nr:hypothetical protein FOA52_009781 [Chlamydomonas sp. UWO 241]